MNHYMTKVMVNRLFKAMKITDVTTTQLCKVLNCGYCDFKAMLDGKSPCYNKWQRKISETLGMEREELFKEFTRPSLETIIRKDLKTMYIVTREESEDKE